MNQVKRCDSDGRSMENDVCIYCDETDQAKFSGREHVIPQAFGKFGAKTPTLRCVCDGCNAIFGRQLDQMLARDTPEGVSRYHQGIYSSEMRLQQRLRVMFSDEEEAGEFVGAELEGIDPTNGQLMPLATQLHIRNQQTGETEVLIRKHLDTFIFSERCYGAPGERELFIYAATKEEHDSFIIELNRAGFNLQMDGPSFSGVKPSVVEDGTPTFGVRVEATFDDLHRRALAKILINFAAYYIGREIVDLPEWKSIKKFVRYGAGELGARLSNKPFWTGQETSSHRFSDAINIRLENHPSGILGVIQFYNLPSYELLLVEGGLLSNEMAARFERGTEPMFGARLTVQKNDYEQASGFRASIAFTPREIDGLRFNSLMNLASK